MSNKRQNNPESLTEQEKDETLLETSTEMERLDSSNHEKPETILLLMRVAVASGEYGKPAQIEIPKVSGSHKLSRPPLKGVKHNAATSAYGVRFNLKAIDENSIVDAVRLFNEKYNDNLVVGSYHLELIR